MCLCITVGKCSSPNTDQCLSPHTERCSSPSLKETNKFVMWETNKPHWQASLPPAETRIEGRVSTPTILVYHIAIIWKFTLLDYCVFQVDVVK